MSIKKRYGCSLKGMRTTLQDTLLEIGKKNSKTMLIDCETGTATNILEFKNEFPDRFITLGVAEQNAISFAFGVARAGFIPIVPLFSAFITRRACDQIFIQVGYARENVKLIGCYSGLTTPNTGATHQSINDISIIRSIPNILIIEACDENELREALISAVEYNGPVYVRMIRSDIKPYEDEIISSDNEFEIGKASILKEGSDITLIGSGLMVSRCMEAANMLSQKEISAEVINCSTVKPLDKDTLLNSVKKTRAAVTAENHSVIGGMGSAITELISENYPVPVERVGIMDKFGESATLEDLFSKYGLTSEAIIEASINVIERKK